MVSEVRTQQGTLMALSEFPNSLCFNNSRQQSVLFLLYSTRQNYNNLLENLVLILSVVVMISYNGHTGIPSPDSRLSWDAFRWIKKNGNANKSSILYQLMLQLFHFVIKKNQHKKKSSSSDQSELGIYQHCGV